MATLNSFIILIVLLFVSNIVHSQIQFPGAPINKNNNNHNNKSPSIDDYSHNPFINPGAQGGRPPSGQVNPSINPGFNGGGPTSGHVNPFNSPINPGPNIGAPSSGHHNPVTNTGTSTGSHGGSQNQGGISFPDLRSNIKCLTYEGRNGICRLLVQCATYLVEIAELSRSPCTITSEQLGVCCLPSKKPTKDTSNALTQKIKTHDVPSPDMPSNDIDSACKRGQSHVNERIIFEQKLADKGIVAEKGSAMYFHARLFETTNVIVKKSQDAQLIYAAAAEIAKRFSLNKEQIENTLPNYDVQNTIIKSVCPPQPVCIHTKYRSEDGSCNNVRNKAWGSAGVAFERIIPPKYSDGLSIPRNSVTGHPLPSPRILSALVTREGDAPYTAFTNMIMQWGQFLDHDMTHTPISKGANMGDITCCNNGQYMDKTTLDLECMPIDIPNDDHFYSQHNQLCMDFVRSMAAVPNDCNFGPRQQMNQITSFIDGSNVYGSSIADSKQLRAFHGGLLRSLSKPGKHFLPGDSKVPGCPPVQNKQCFKAGDSRVNEAPDLVVIHTIWMRQHNNIAKQLANINPHWNDEIIYQETRRIVIAQMQHITYNEYLPIVLGTEFMSTYGLNPLRHGYFKGYRTDVNPTINNVFAAAAFRYGHTLINSLVESYSKFGARNAAEELSKTAFKPYSVYIPGNFDALLRGLSLQPSQKFDHIFSNELTNKLFAQDRAFGMDLVSLNIQRGRDHGLPSYNHWRESCRLKRANTWADLRDVMEQSVIDSMSRLYQSVEDVDLYIGGISEKPLKGSLLGPTFLCVVGDQFARIKIGDRFFYENGGLPSSFSEGQMNEIRKTSLARVMCDNSESLEIMQPLAFVVGTLANRRAECNSSKLIPNVDLYAWRNEPVWP